MHSVKRLSRANVHEYINIDHMIEQNMIETRLARWSVAMQIAPASTVWSRDA